MSKLPPLPPLDLSRDALYGYTADQMRAYAEQAVAAERERCATLAGEQAIEIQRLRDALNTAGGALWRINPACIDDDEERKKAERARFVGLQAVEEVLERRVYVEGVGLRGGLRAHGIE